MQLVGRTRIATYYLRMFFVVQKFTARKRAVLSPASPTLRLQNAHILIEFVLLRKDAISCSQVDYRFLSLSKLRPYAPIANCNRVY